MEDDFDITIKILIVGDSGVGKTNFVNKFINNEFDQNYMSTTGIDLKSGNIQLKNKKIRIQIWDTAGQERYRSITKNLFLKVMGALIMYDITKANTFNNLQSWLNLINEECGKHMQIVLVGNKSDLDSQREISKEKVINFAKKQNVEYIETSSKTGDHVTKAITLLTEKILENNDIGTDASIRLDSASFTRRKGKKKCCYKIIFFIID